LAVCRRVLEQTGGALILYPEGTRSPDGEMRAFKTGAGLFAIELGIPLVPAHIEGTHRILPKGHSLPRSGPLTVRFGKALTLATLPWRGESIRDRRRVAVEQLARNIRLLSLGYRAREFAAKA
jgi:1-acyl-sn-glycerol-3-phosphate acyltransferase